MNITLIASVASSLLFIIAFGMYLASIARGKIRVSVSTFTVLGIASLSQLFSLAIVQSWYSAAFMAIATIVNFSVVYLGLRHKNYEFKLLDKISLLAAVLGLLAWYFTKDPAVNVYILTIAILISIIPAVRKTFKDPTSEDKLPWLIILIASFVFLFTITSINPVSWIVPARQMFFAGLMNIALFYPLAKRTK